MTIEAEKQSKKLPERKKSFIIKDNTYDVEFPNTGGLLDIEVLKAQLSRGQYNEILSSGTIRSNYVRALIDMISTFTVLFPKLKKDMNVSSISELKPEDSKVLLKVYLDKVNPWLKEWEEYLNSDDEDQKE